MLIDDRLAADQESLTESEEQELLPVGEPVMQFEHHVVAADLDEGAVKGERQLDEPLQVTITQRALLQVELALSTVRTAPSPAL